MNKCNAFVLPSRYETFGVVYIEALASGKPVIGTYNGGAEGIINKEVGYLVPIDDIDALSNAMEEIISNINNFDNHKLRNYCKENFSADVIIKNIIDVYKKTINEFGGKKNEV